MLDDSRASSRAVNPRRTSGCTTAVLPTRALPLSPLTVRSSRSGQCLRTSQPDSLTYTMVTSGCTSTVRPARALPLSPLTVRSLRLGSVSGPPNPTHRPIRCCHFYTPLRHLVGGWAPRGPPPGERFPADLSPPHRTSSLTRNSRSRRARVRWFATNRPPI